MPSASISSSMQLIRMARNLSEHGILDNGRPATLHDRARFFSGAPPPIPRASLYFRPLRLGKKVEAGARFVQTQLIYKCQALQDLHGPCARLGLHEKVYILAGVADQVGCGSQIHGHQGRRHGGPGRIVNRMTSTPKAAQPEEGLRICGEIIGRQGDTRRGPALTSWRSTGPSGARDRDPGSLPRPNRSIAASPLCEPLVVSGPAEVPAP